MTKKRFIKLIMSYEIQRNEAERIAPDVAQYGSYEEMFESIRAVAKAIQEMLEENEQ